MYSFATATSTIPRNGHPRLLFVDDHHILLDALSWLASNEFEVRGAASLEGLDKLIDEFEPDLVIFDLRMPDGEPLDYARSLLSARPDRKVMFLSMYTDAREVKRAMEAGARAFVSKRTSGPELLNAIRTVLAGGRYVSPQTEMLAQGPADAECPLTDRQKQVLRLIAYGASAKEIAAELNISVRTAEFHRAAIMERLKLNSTALLTRYALDHGIA